MGFEGDRTGGVIPSKGFIEAALKYMATSPQRQIGGIQRKCRREENFIYIYIHIYMYIYQKFKTRLIRNSKRKVLETLPQDGTPT